MTYYFEKCEANEYTYRIQLLDQSPTHDKSKEYFDFVKELDWTGPVFAISSVARIGTEKLMQAIYQELKLIAPEKFDPEMITEESASVKSGQSSGDEPVKTYHPLD